MMPAKLLGLVAILIAGISISGFAGQRNSDEPFNELDSVLRFGAFDDPRGGFEIGNHRWVENLTGFFRFAVDRDWKATTNDVFTDVYPEESETHIEVGLEPDISFRQVSEYVQYMVSHGWSPVEEGPLKGRAVRDRLREAKGKEYGEWTVRLYKKPGETVVFNVGADLTQRSDIREVNRVLSTFELIPQ